MKKYLLIIVLLFINSRTWSQTSVYHPFPDSAAVWNYDVTIYCFTQGISYQDYSVIITGDTLINGLTYHKLFTPFVQVINVTVCGVMPVGYKGAFRHDGVNKKVYFVPPSDSLEQLLYDFNLQVGDTVNGYLGNVAQPKDVVIAIDSVQVGSDYRNRWKINSCYDIYVIEGIGSTYGLTIPSPGCLVDLPDIDLTCFSQNGNNLYPDTMTGCDVITGVSEISVPSVAVSVVPNPFQTKSTLMLSQSFKDAGLSIFNPLGNLVFKTQFQNTASYEINGAEWPAGIYLIKLENGRGEVSTQKLLLYH